MSELNKVNDILEKLLIEKVNSIDIESIANDAVREQLDYEARKSIKEAINNLSGDVIQNKISEILDEGVETDNGFGEKKTYQRFDDLLKATINKKMDNTWQMEKVIKQTIQARVDAMVNSKMKEVTEKMVDELTETKIKK